MLLSNYFPIKPNNVFLLNKMFSNCVFIVIFHKQVPTIIKDVFENDNTPQNIFFLNLIHLLKLDKYFAGMYGQIFTAYDSNIIRPTTV